MFIVFIPVWMLLFLPLRMLMIGVTDGFLKAAGTIHWGLMLTVFTVSHAAYLMSLPALDTPGAGSVGLLLFLMVLTEFNDVAQFVSGKLFGRAKIVPTVSPGKTWAGFIGGIVLTTLAAAGLAPLLTPLLGWHGPAAGAIIAVAGFFGDVTMSAIKRDLRVKDSGSLIPGHGGILDRIDSLTFTAPVFFHYVFYLYYGPPLKSVLGG
jgi:phosphatidate cytidylyltransferase